MEAIEALSTESPKLRADGLASPNIPGPSTPPPTQQKEKRRDEENTVNNVLEGTSRLKILLVEG